MSDSPDNVVSIGGGGLLYEDAREQAAQIAQQARLNAPGAEDFAEDFAPDIPKPQPSKPAQATQVTQKNPPEPEQPGPDYREFFSTCVELLGVTCISVGGWLIAPYIGLIIAGIALIALGIATSRLVSGR
jgi:hypothetical protein